MLLIDTVELIEGHNTKEDKTVDKLERIIREQLAQKIETLGSVVFASDDKKREMLPKEEV